MDIDEMGVSVAEALMGKMRDKENSDGTAKCQSRVALSVFEKQKENKQQCIVGTDIGKA
jgi:hypothetical protein